MASASFNSSTYFFRNGMFRILVGCSLLASAMPLRAEVKVLFKEPPHSYLEREPRDRLAMLMKKVDKQDPQVEIDTSSDRAFLISFLKALDVPISSQILVFSATSLQSEIINPRNARALYFNEDTYVGWVPGGRLEVIGIDPEYGPMFYVFDRLRPGSIPRVDKSQKCFNCHAGTATNHIPGLIAESVLVSPAGSSLETFRRDVQGHQIPLEDRFGGWHLTGEHHLRNTHANLYGRPQGGSNQLVKVMPGDNWDINLHLLPTSDILPNLIHEHQLGFENRVFQAGYAVRQLLSDGKGRLTKDGEAEVDRMAKELARYILFADEAKLPAEGVVGDPGFVRDFARNRLPLANGAALKDLDLRTHIFKYRCSYMLYTESWQALPTLLKDRVYYRMAEGLRDTDTPADLSHLPVAERRAIRAILKGTLEGLPSWWR